MKIKRHDSSNNRRKHKYQNKSFWLKFAILFLIVWKKGNIKKIIWKKEKINSDEKKQIVMINEDS